MNSLFSVNKNRVSWLFAVILCLFVFSSCSVDNKLYDKTFFAMDTLMTVSSYDTDEAVAELAAEQCRLEAVACENLFSTNIEKSDVSLLNGAGGVAVTVSPQTAELLDAAKGVSALTSGAFDITVYPLVRLWGFSSGEYRLPEDSEIKSILPVRGSDCIAISGSEVSMPDGVKIDLGGIAKGYLGDRLRTVITENGVTSAVLSLGGNIVLIGDKPGGELWSVAVKNPENPSEYFCTFSYQGGVSVVTSGGYERCFEVDGVEYHHIINPVTGYPAESDITSVTVIGENGACCDALSTALFVMGSEKALEFLDEHQEYDYVILTDSDVIYSSIVISAQPEFKVLTQR